MTGVAVVLTLAYVAVAALLLNLNLATRWNVFVKAGAIVLVTGLYAVAWHGHKGLLGWATGEPLPDEFRVHWVTIDEPDKTTGGRGAIYFWVRELTVGGLPHGPPRAYRVAWNEVTGEAAEEALERLEEGELLNGRMRPDIATVDGGDSGGDAFASSSSGDRPQLEFSRVPPPVLPPKPPPGG